MILSSTKIVNVGGSMMTEEEKPELLAGLRALLAAPGFGSAQEAAERLAIVPPCGCGVCAAGVGPIRDGDPDGGKS
jgi:hypothetical protein